MKRFVFVLAALIITLSGCSVKQTSAFECVNDNYEQFDTPAFYIDAVIPQDAVLTHACDDGCCAVFTHEDYEIYQEIFEAESLDAACRRLTGRSVSQLRAIQTQSFPIEEYRFAFQAAGEGRTLSCCGKFFYDGQFCYAVSVHCPMQKEPEYHEVFSELLSLTELKAI